MPIPSSFSPQHDTPSTITSRANMHSSLAIFALTTLSVTAQRIFINQVPAYSQLPPCAEAPLSNIVRNMVSGCGDGGKTTSYDCFCVSSSTKFESIISRVVASKCMPAKPEATASALAVFDSYCHLSPQATPALASQTPRPSDSRPLYLSESSTALELSTSVLSTSVLSTSVLTTSEVDTSSTLVTAASAEITPDSSESSVQRPPARLSPTPSRTQLAPIPSASLALSGAQSLGNQWLASFLALWGLGMIML